MDIRSLRGRTALVTGGASGIGRATAVALARRGARLVVCDVNDEGLSAVAAELRGLGADVLAHRVDVARVCRGGHAVNVSSVAGYVASEALAAYITTKFAVFGLSEALRQELAPHGIGVTTVCPGIIDTPITASSPLRGPERPRRRAPT